MMCDMCGNKQGTLIADVEGTRMTLCQDCSSFGKIISRIVQAIPEKQKQKTRTATTAKPAEDEVMLIIVADFGHRIRQKREKLGLKQEELARRLSEKESLLHQIESGKFVPGITLARKFEKSLGIALIEEHREKRTTGVAGSSDPNWTIGDVLTGSKRER